MSTVVGLLPSWIVPYTVPETVIAMTSVPFVPSSGWSTGIPIAQSILVNPTFTRVRVQPSGSTAACAGPTTPTDNPTTPTNTRAADPHPRHIPPAHAIRRIVPISHTPPSTRTTQRRPPPLAQGSTPAISATQSPPQPQTRHTSPTRPNNRDQPKPQPNTPTPHAPLTGTPRLPRQGSASPSQGPTLRAVSCASLRTVQIPLPSTRTGRSAALNDPVFTGPEPSAR